MNQICINKCIERYVYISICLYRAPTKTHPSTFNFPERPICLGTLCAVSLTVHQHQAPTAMRPCAKDALRCTSSRIGTTTLEAHFLHFCERSVVTSNRFAGRAADECRFFQMKREGYMYCPGNDGCSILIRRPVFESTLSLSAEQKHLQASNAEFDNK